MKKKLKRRHNKVLAMKALLQGSLPQDSESALLIQADFMWLSLTQFNTDELPLPDG